MSLIRKFSQNNNIENYLNIVSGDQQILSVLNSKDGTTKNQKFENKIVSKIAADFFIAINKGGITIHDVMKKLYEDYGTNQNKEALEKIGEENKIKIIHCPYTVQIGNTRLKNDRIPFYLKTNNSRFGIFKTNTAHQQNNTVYNINNVLNNQKTNKRPNDPIKSKPNIVSILYNDPDYRFGSRNETELSFFFNSFTNIDISKIYPYVNLSIKMPSIIDNGLFKKKYETSTINQHLFGTIEKENKTKNYDIFNAYDAKLVSHSVYGKNKREEKKVIGTGMNIAVFSMPQTVNNFNEKSIGQSRSDVVDDNRINPVLDITRPLATIKSLNFNVSSTYDLQGHKQGDLTLLVHDRSRLPDLAPFLKPDLFGVHGAEIVLEYGWSHIDGDDENNPKAQIINSMRIKEKYMIQQTSSTIDQFGQVNIKVTISQVGMNSFKSIVSNKTEAALTVNNINTSKQKIKNILRHVNHINKESANKIRYSFDNELMNVITLTKISSRSQEKSNELQRLLDRTLNKINNNFKFTLDNISRYVEIVPKNLLQTRDGQELIKKNIKDNGPLFNYLKNELIELKKLCKELNNKTKVKTKKTQGEISKIFGNEKEDPYIDKELLKLIMKGKSHDSVIKEYCSFGKIATNIIGNNISSLGKFDEVQIIFHTTNENSGFMRTQNISSFLIEKKAFKEFMTEDIFSPLRNIEYSVEALFARIVHEFIKVEDQVCYGFKDIISSKDPNGDINYRDKIKEKIKVIGITEFTMPDIKVFLDCISPSTEGLNNSIDKDKTILRISFIDSKDDPYMSINNTLKQVTETNDIIKIKNALATVNRKKSTMSQAKFDKARIDKINKLISQGVDIQKDGNDIIMPSEGLKNLKEQIKRNVPTVVLGAINSPVKSASASLSTVGELVAIIIEKGSMKYDVSGVKFDSDLPLRVVPSQVTLKMLGCPFINFGQYVFVDFLTGTNIDNTYVTTSLSHSISPGSFETSIVFGQGSANAYGEAYSGIEEISRFLAEIDKRQIKVKPKQPPPSPNSQQTTSNINDLIEDAKKIYFHNKKSYNYTNSDIDKIKESKADTVAVTKPSYINFKKFFDDKIGIDKKENIDSYNSYIKILFPE
jgi:hypothetical protein